MTGYLTLAGPATGELEIRRSRFLTFLLPVRSEAEARTAVAEVRGSHPQARHHCTAMVIGPGGSAGPRLQRSSDDGEPSGTAGAPMLEVLTTVGISDVLAVVVRYFGGVLLGAGGLTRAYRAAVADTLATAPLVQRAERELVEVAVDYPVAHQLEIEAHRAGWTVSASYGAQVQLQIAVPADEVAEVTARVAQVSGGSARVRSGGTRWVDLPGTP